MRTCPRSCRWKLPTSNVSWRNRGSGNMPFNFRVDVENTRPDISTAAVLERLEEALALIEQFQPIRFRHLQRDLRRILVVRYPCRGAYIPAERTCITELTFLARRDIPASVVASSILHEG